MNNLNMDLWVRPLVFTENKRISNPFKFKTDNIVILSEDISQIIETIQSLVELDRQYENRKFTAKSMDGKFKVTDPFNNESGFAEHYGDFKKGEPFGSLGINGDFEVYGDSVRFIYHNMSTYRSEHPGCGTLYEKLYSNGVLFHNQRCGQPLGFGRELTIGRKIKTNLDFKEATIDFLKHIYFEHVKEQYRIVFEQELGMKFNFSPKVDDDYLPF